MFKILYFDAFLHHQYLVLLPYWKLLETHRKCKFVSLFEILDYLCNCILNRIRWCIFNVGRMISHLCKYTSLPEPCLVLVKHHGDGIQFLLSKWGQDQFSAVARRHLHSAPATAQIWRDKKFIWEMLRGGQQDQGPGDWLLPTNQQTYLLSQHRSNDNKPSPVSSIVFIISV